MPERPTVTRLIVALCAILNASPLRAAETCEPSWSDAFQPPEAYPSDPDCCGEALAVFDDGTGPALYVGGHSSKHLGERAAPPDGWVYGLLKWDGARWSPVGGGLSRGGSVAALAVFDDGNGPALYVGGMFTSAGSVAVSGFARWDGSQWSAVGKDFSGGVHELEVFDYGTGPALYAAGYYMSSGERQLGRLARWDGKVWSAVEYKSAPIMHLVTLMEVYDDGNGSQLYAVGSFAGLDEDGTPYSRYIARWDGTTWSALGQDGEPHSSGRFGALTVFDDGTGPALYGGGRFSERDKSPADDNLFRWDGTQWSVVDTGPYGQVEGLTVFDDGTGPALYVATRDSRRWGPPSVILRGDGHRWEPITAEVNVHPNPVAFAAYNDARGPALYVAGTVATDEFLISGLGRWERGRWSLVGNGLKSADDSVLSLQAVDLGHGPKLFAGGSFDGGVAEWDGVRWLSLERGLTGYVSHGPINSLAGYDDGSGTALYASGIFRSARNEAAESTSASTLGIARWNGVEWSAVGTLEFGAGHILTTFDGGDGTELIVGGVWRWNGKRWATLGDAMPQGGPVLASTVFDDGTGPALYVGGMFTEVGGVTTNAIARWNGSQWADVGGGFGDHRPKVYALAVHDDGSGPALYAGGSFWTKTDPPVWYAVARFNGNAWTGVVSGDGTALNYLVRTLKVYDDGRGPALYAGGEFIAYSGPEDATIARWDGSEWTAIDAGIDVYNSYSDSPTVNALETFNDRWGKGLYAGGHFYFVDGAYQDGILSANIARWGCQTVRGDCNGDGFLTLYDHGSLSGCIGGPSVATSPECECGDLDGDGDFDLRDIAHFQKWFSHP